jgi:hypothetical protein
MKNEESIQQEIVIWFNNKFCLKTSEPRCMIFSVPNDSSSFMETKRKVNTGLLKGVSDLIVIIPNKILFIELKTEIGIQSAVQKDFQSRIELLGYEYHLIRSLTAFQELFK